MSVFRKNYGCNHVLLKLVEDWKIALDNGEYVFAILTDLSKAFDCLLHRLANYVRYVIGCMYLDKKLPAGQKATGQNKQCKNAVAFVYCVYSNSYDVSMSYIDTYYKVRRQVSDM